MCGLGLRPRPAPVGLIARGGLLLSLAVLAALSPVAAAELRTHPAGSGLERDVLGSTMAGEYALQAGRLDEAVEWYLNATRAADGDAGLAERTTRIALLGNDDRKAAEALALWKARVPRSLPIRAAEATLAMRGGKQRVARRELESLLRDPDPTAWRYAVSVLGSGSRDPQVPARLIAQLLDAGAIPDELQAWMAMGTLAYGLEQGDLADRISQQIVARFPGEPRVALLRARQLRDAGRPDDARALLVAVETVAQSAPELRFAIAAEYDALGDFKDADRLLAQGPQNTRVAAMRASLLARADDTEGLAALYETLKQDSAAPEPLQRLLLGQTAEYLKRFEEALDWYATVPAGTERLQARFRSAVVLHELKRNGEATAALRQMQSDATLEEPARLNAYLVEAELHQKDGADEAEADVYARGLAAYPDEAALLYSRGLMWERRDEIARAEADLRRILVADPENVAALNALGYTLADRTQRYEEALELIERARVAEPDNPAIIDSYGWVLYRLGRNEDALVHLRRAYTMQKDAEIGAHVGEVLWVLGRKDEARRYFEEARKIDPDNRSLQRALEKVGA
ncbi:tetratricopeptide repeat protein [Luteimonas sp. RIT-PG2_3]